VTGSGEVVTVPGGSYQRHPPPGAEEAPSHHLVCILISSVSEISFYLSGDIYTCGEGIIVSVVGGFSLREYL
jgi:hypothetical protein